MQMTRAPFKRVIETLFRIPNKRGEIVPFILNNIQQDLHNHLLKNSFLDILKFRQGGITSLIMAFFLVECLSKFCVCVMIAHDKDHTERLLQRCRLFLDLLKGPSPRLSKLNDQELLFTKTHSTFYIGTAGSRTFGRSATITHLHCSEYAFWRAPQALMAGLMQAVPSTGLVIKESTANGFGTLHHKQFMRAFQGDSKFKGIFYPWYIFEEYQSETPLSSPLTPKEEELQQKFNLSLPQLQWRREKLEEFEGDPQLFAQEYPATVEEAFLVSGGSMVPQLVPIPSELWGRTSVGGVPVALLSRHPTQGKNYVFGVDVSGGTGNDYSAVQGLCLETNEQVLAYRTNTLAPPAFAATLIELGKLFNTAYLVVEANQHGLSVLECLRQDYNMQKLYKTFPSTKRVDYGFKTTSISKYKLLGILQKSLPELQIYDPPTVQELVGFGETDLGTLGNLHAGHDDMVIALALACLGRLKQSYIIAEKKEQPKVHQPSNIISLEDILSRLPSRRKKTFLKDQTFYGEHTGYL